MNVKAHQKDLSLETLLWVWFSAEFPPLWCRNYYYKISILCYLYMKLG